MTTHPDYINAAFKGGSFQKNVVSGRENGANSPDQGTISTRLKRCSQKLEQFVLTVSAECQSRAIFISTRVPNPRGPAEKLKGRKNEMLSREEFSRLFQSCSSCVWWRAHPEVSRSCRGS